jgi:hypothetical protein
MITTIFTLVANGLKQLAQMLNFTYNEINILIYFALIPLSWLMLLDYIFAFHYLKVAFLIFVMGFRVGCTDFKTYSDVLFMKSVNFLNYFNRFGSNYFNTSVWVCVYLPIVIYSILIYNCF